MSHDGQRDWFHLQERGALWAMRLVLTLYRLLGRRVCVLVINLVVVYYWLTHTTARRASRDYLRRLARQAPETGITGGVGDSLRHFRAFGLTLLDKLGAWRGDIGVDRVTLPDRTPLLQALDQGRGAVLISAHIGNMEVCRAISRLRPDIRLNVLVHTRHAEKFNQLLNEVSGDARLSLIQVSDLSPATAIRLHDCVERGELVVIMGDRVPLSGQHRTSSVEFLGSPALFPQGPFILASLLKCPVLTLFCTHRQGGYVIRFAPLAERVILPRRDRQGALHRYIGEFAAQIEERCRETPLQWFNFYDFWHRHEPRP